MIPFKESSYLIRSRSENEKVKRDGCEQINREPAFDIVLGYPAWLCDHLVIVVHIRCAKVDDYIHNKQHVHQKVRHIQGVTCVAAAPLTYIPVLIQEEGGWVRCENSCVEDQEENNPVPKCLEGAVVKQDPPCCFWHLNFVLRQDIRLQRKDLKVKNSSVCSKSEYCLLRFFQYVSSWHTVHLCTYFSIHKSWNCNSSRFTQSTLSVATAS